MSESLEQTNLRITPRLTAAASLIAGQGYRRLIINKAAGKREPGLQLNFQGDVRELMQRSTLSGSGTGITNTENIGVYGGGPGRSVYLQDLLSQGTTGANILDYARENGSWTNAADATTDGDEIPEQGDFSLDPASAKVTNAGVWMKTTEETLADYQNLSTFINEQLVRRVKLKIESLILNSDGNAPNYMVGFMEVGVPTVSVGTAGSMLEAIQESIAQIEANGYTPSFLALNPTDKRALYSASAAGPVLVWDNGVLLLYGIPVIGTSAVTEGTGLVGDGSQAAVMYRSGIGGTAYRTETTNMDQDDFINDLITIRATARAALVIQSLGAFSEIVA